MPFGPPSTHDLKIFDVMPVPNETTFNAGVPAQSTTNEMLSIILYSPNLEIIASLDNTKSAVTSDYNVSVSNGFTFTTTQSVSVKTSVGISIEIVTASVETTFALSFSEQWNTTRTQGMSFSCPPGKKAFVYQGTLISRVMALNAQTAQYEWFSAAGKALTQVLVTTEAPIGNAPSSPVTMK
ncbi:hypothetical protein [Thalassospira mesophila]|uniref:hypothetical protein n=1 Tax=Thalassospira mesophila TaxID=1293891 RepID=UPI00117E01E5|nr:hypothetical protein [Thalassospira mesophila]